MHNKKPLLLAHSDFVISLKIRNEEEEQQSASAIHEELRREREREQLPFLFENIIDADKKSVVVDVGYIINHAKATLYCK